MAVLLQQAGSIGLPAGVKEAGQRVDFKPDKFTLAIETKGYRLAWSRANYCPCTPVNAQTEQPDPNCSLCEGSGWLMFAPAGATYTETVVGDLDDVQQVLVTDSAIIHGIMTSITNQDVPYDQVVHRMEGTMNVTVRPENKLGYYDRLINLDTTVVYAQIVETDGTDTTKTRYPIRTMNRLQSEDQVYTEGSDFDLVSGDIVWTTTPASGLRLAAHYLTHPHWRVIEHPHAARLSPVKFKTNKPLTPQGDPNPLPVQALAKYEFLL